MGIHIEGVLAKCLVERSVVWHSALGMCGIFAGILAQTTYASCFLSPNVLALHCCIIAEGFHLKFEGCAATLARHQLELEIGQRISVPPLLLWLAAKEGDNCKYEVMFLSKYRKKEVKMGQK